MVEVHGRKRDYFVSTQQQQPFIFRLLPQVETAMIAPFYLMASMVWFQCVFAAIAVILLAGSLLGRMNIRAWMAFVPLWLTFSYTMGVFSLWGGGFLFHWGVMDYSGGYVIHLSSGVASFTAAYWVSSHFFRFPCQLTWKK